MDPTMQSPRRLTIPVPPPFDRLPPLSGGIQVTVPSGPHHYSTKSWIGSISQGNTPQQAFDALSRHATPFQGGQSIDGGVVDIPNFGSVRQLVDPDHLTIVNTTEPGHRFHPGNVFRSIVQEGDHLYVVTQGYGTGIFPSLNEIGAHPLWGHTDLGVRRELNPYPVLGYPADEMNAVAGMGRDAPPRAGETAAIPDSKPMRYLSGRYADNPPGSAFDVGAPRERFVLPDQPSRSGDVSGKDDWFKFIAGLTR